MDDYLKSTKNLDSKLSSILGRFNEFEKCALSPAAMEGAPLANQVGMFQDTLSSLKVYVKSESEQGNAKSEIEEFVLEGLRRRLIEIKIQLNFLSQDSMYADGESTRMIERSINQSIHELPSEKSPQ